MADWVNWDAVAQAAIPIALVVSWGWKSSKAKRKRTRDAAWSDTTAMLDAGAPLPAAPKRAPRSRWWPYLGGVASGFVLGFGLLVGFGLASDMPDGYAERDARIAAQTEVRRLNGELAKSNDTIRQQRDAIAERDRAVANREAAAQRLAAELAARDRALADRCTRGVGLAAIGAAFGTLMGVNDLWQCVVEDSARTRSTTR